MIDLNVASTNASRSLRTRLMTATPSILTGHAMPKMKALFALRAASAAAISNLDGHAADLRARRPGKAVIDEKGRGTSLACSPFRSQSCSFCSNNYDVRGQIVHLICIYNILDHGIAFDAYG